MKRNVTGTVPEMLQRMNDDVLYSLEQVQSFAMKNFRRVPSSKRRGKRSPPLSFIEDLTKGIVGLATMDDVGRIAQRVNQLVEKGNQISGTLTKHLDNYDSFVRLSNSRYESMKSIVKDNHDVLAELVEEQTDFQRLNAKVLKSHIDLTKQLNKTIAYKEYLREVNQLAYGRISPLLIQNKEIGVVMRSITKMLTDANDLQQLIYPDPKTFHQHSSFVVHRKRFDLWISLKFPVAHIEKNDLYRLAVYPVPIEKGKLHSTVVNGLPDYVVVKDQGWKYARITAAQYMECKVESTMTTCPFPLVFDTMERDACLSGLYNNNGELIHRHCDFRYFQDNIKSGFQMVTNTKALVYDLSTGSFTVNCNGKTHSVKGCNFCLLDVPCNCVIKTVYQDSITSAWKHCKGDVKDTITTKHLINFAAVKSFFEENVKKEVTASSTYDEEQSIKLPNISFFEHEYQQFLATDQKNNLDFKKIAKNAKQNRKTFLSAAEPLLDVDLGFDKSWPDVSGTIALVALGISVMNAIVVICICKKSFGSVGAFFLGQNIPQATANAILDRTVPIPKTTPKPHSRKRLVT